MKSKFLLYSLVVIFATLHCFNNTHAESRPVKTLSDKEQSAFLSSRNKAGGGMILGSFDSYCSLLYAACDVAIHTESSEINSTGLQSIIPDFYKPTWRELFDVIAIQTQSSWSYDPTRNFWVFTKPQKPRTYYSIEIAKGWEQNDCGLYVGYHPPIAPVGMDIYILGTYTSDDPKKADDLCKKLKEDFAITFAKVFQKDVTQKDMKNVRIGNYEALHFETKASNGVIWRQWVIIDEGRAFVIVSAIKPEHEAVVYPDVQKMIQSFRISK